MTVELLSIIDDVVIIKRTSTFLYGPKGRVQKKHKKKLKNVSLYVCMSAENSKMLVFFYVFFPTVVIYRLFQRSLRKKNIKMLVFMEYVCM